MNHITKADQDRGWPAIADRVYNGRVRIFADTAPDHLQVSWLGPGLELPHGLPAEGTRGRLSFVRGATYLLLRFTPDP